jgi:hypothetical protein
LQLSIDETMDSIEDYTEANKLALNRDKTQLMILSRNRDQTTELIVNNNDPNLIVRPVNSIKLLGILISSDLKWNKYLISGKNCLLQQLKSRNTMLQKVCPYTSKPDSIKLANGLFSSKLLYGMESWGSAPDYIIKKLQAQQTASMHIVHGYQSKKWNRTRLLKETGWLKINLLIQLTSSKLTHKILNGEGPELLTEMMKPTTNPNIRQTRANMPGKLGNKPNSLGRTNYTKYTYRNLAYTHYSSIPSELTDIISSVNYKKRIKRYLTNNDDLPIHRCTHTNCQQNITCHTHHILSPSTSSTSSSSSSSSSSSPQTSTGEPGTSAQPDGPLQPEAAPHPGSPPQPVSTHQPVGPDNPEYIRRPETRAQPVTRPSQARDHDARPDHNEMPDHDFSTVRPVTNLF